MTNGKKPVQGFTPHHERPGRESGDEVLDIPKGDVQKPRTLVRGAGFTLIELIMVLTSIGFISLLVAPQFTNVTATRASYVASKIQSDVRYAQLLAMSSQARTRVVFNISTDTYDLEREISAGSWTAITHPSTRANYSETLNAGDYAGVDITAAVFNAASTLIFDSYGAPFDGAGSAIIEPAYAELNSGAYRMNVRANTGKIDIS